jgi:hypothetical protein
MLFYWWDYSLVNNFLYIYDFLKGLKKKIILYILRYYDIFENINIYCKIVFKYQIIKKSNIFTKCIFSSLLIVI